MRGVVQCCRWAAIYLTLFVLGSYLLQFQIGRRIWRRLHYVVFPAGVLMFAHSIFTDLELKDGHPDLLDGGKIFIEIAEVLAVAATVIRYGMRKQRLRAR